MAVATFAMGCFWHPQKLFEEVEGVTSTQVGYTGGEVEDPTYRQVCSGTTGHAEAVRVEFDPEVVSYEELLSVFFENHNFCQLNRQGPDIGEQYRSAIFYHDKRQKKLAEDAMPDDAVTQVVQATDWWPAEEYHQHYLRN